MPPDDTPSAVSANEATDDYSKFRRKLDGLDGEFVPLLGGTENVAKFKRVVLNAISVNPELLEADRRTLLIACMKAAQDGLLPDGREAVLNIYSTKVKEGNREKWIKMVQYLPMVHGMIKKLYESGQVTYVDAAAVYEKDDFSYERGDVAKLTHKPYLGAEPGPIIASYLVAKLKNGEIKREVMPKRDIDRVRAASKSANGPGWRDWEDQFAIKSVIKRGYKQLPNSPELEKVIAADNAALGFTQFDAHGGMLDRQPDRSEPAQIEHQPTNTIDGPKWDSTKFAEKLTGWRKSIEAGRRTVEDVISAAETLGPLTTEQKDAIKGEKPKSAEPDAPSSDVPAEASLVDGMRAQAREATISDREILKHVGAESFEKITRAQVDKALAFIADPVGEQS